MDIEALKQTFHENWKEEQAETVINWQGEEEQERTTGWALLETYFKETPITLDEKPEAVEVSVEADLSEHGLPRLIGVIDLVRAGGRIVDFKTASQTPTVKKAQHLHEAQTSCYAIMYRESTGRKESGIELHHLVKLKKPKIVVTPFEPMTDNQQTRLFKGIESYVAGLDRQDFVPSPSRDVAVAATICGGQGKRFASRSPSNGRRQMKLARASRFELQAPSSATGQWLVRGHHARTHRADNRRLQDSGGNWPRRNGRSL